MCDVLASAVGWDWRRLTADLRLSGIRPTVDVTVTPREDRVRVVQHAAPSAPSRMANHRCVGCPHCFLVNVFTAIHSQQLFLQRWMSPSLLEDIVQPSLPSVSSRTVTTNELNGGILLCQSDISTDNNNSLLTQLFRQRRTSPSLIQKTLFETPFHSVSSSTVLQMSIGMAVLCKATSQTHNSLFTTLLIKKVFLKRSCRF